MQAGDRIRDVELGMGTVVEEFQCEGDKHIAVDWDDGVPGSVEVTDDVQLIISAAYSLDLRLRLSRVAIMLKEDGDWQTCDLLREARNVIERLARSAPAVSSTIWAGDE